MTVISQCLFGAAGSMNTTADWWFGPTLQTWGRHATDSARRKVCFVRMKTEI